MIDESHYIYGQLFSKGDIIMAQVAKGLEGIIASETQISSIIDNQLTYAGYEIDDLTENALFEEVMFLLWNLRLPNKEELAELNEKLLGYMTLNLECIHISKIMRLIKFIQ